MHDDVIVDLVYLFEDRTNSSPYLIFLTSAIYFVMKAVWQTELLESVHLLFATMFTEQYKMKQQDSVFAFYNKTDGDDF